MIAFVNMYAGEVFRTIFYRFALIREAQNEKFCRELLTCVNLTWFFLFCEGLFDRGENGFQ